MIKKVVACSSLGLIGGVVMIVCAFVGAMWIAGQIDEAEYDDGSWTQEARRG